MQLGAPAAHPIGKLPMMHVRKATLVCLLLPAQAGSTPGLDSLNRIALDAGGRIDHQTALRVIERARDLHAAERRRQLFAGEDAAEAIGLAAGARLFGVEALAQDGKTSLLAVAKITPAKICVTDRIKPGAGQNLEARIAADDAGSKVCLASAPM